MFLSINITAGAKGYLNSFSYNKATSELISTSSDRTDIELKLNLPFSLKKTPDLIFDPSADIDQILIFRNQNFKEKSLIRLKYKVGETNKTFGFIFSLSGILETENILEDNKEVIPYAARALVSLLNNKSSLLAKVPDYNPTSDYSLFDFYDDDLLICAISKQQLLDYSKEIELSLLYQLNLYGFYLLNNDENRSFHPENNIYHQTALNSILNPQSLGSILIQKLSQKILSEPYFNTYVTTLINKSQSYISKFFLIYQCFEILIDFVSKSEIITKICTEGAVDDKSGFQVKEIMNKIGNEGYRMDKLFSHYSKYAYESDYHISTEIMLFFGNYKTNYEIQTEHSSGHYFYELRNTIVHNLRILFSGTVEEIQRKEDDLKLLITNIEFLTVETLIGLKI